MIRLLQTSTPLERLIFWASSQAAMTAAWAPAFHNDPTREGLYGFAVGLMTGLPVYGYAVRMRRREMRR